MLPQWLSGEGLPSWVVPLVGLAITGLILLVGRGLSWLRRPSPRPPTPAREADPRSGLRPVPPALERRKSPRHKGSPVRVLISDADARAEPEEGWVLDRSTDGLCLSAAQAVAVGTLLSVRPSYPAAIPWALVEVEGVRPQGARWALGCRFVDTPPWKALVALAEPGVQPGGR